MSFQPEISKNYGMTEWREDLKSLLRSTGASGKGTVFLLTDSQIKEESFLEDVDSLLNTGEVPNLFAADEKAEIMEVSTVDAVSCRQTMIKQMISQVLNKQICY